LAHERSSKPVQLRVRKQRGAASANKKEMNNMSQIESNIPILSNAELDGVVGGSFLGDVFHTVTKVFVSHAVTAVAPASPLGVFAGAAHEIGSILKFL
jgi:hypothetical protein